MRDEVFLVHADAGVGDGEGLLLFVELEVDARRIDAVADERLVLVVDEGEVTQLVERVGGVGDELAEKDLRVGVERMDDELEELAYFSLELLLGHDIFNYCQKPAQREGGRELAFFRPGIGPGHTSNGCFAKRVSRYKNTGPGNSFYETDFPGSR